MWTVAVAASMSATIVFMTSSESPSSRPLLPPTAGKPEIDAPTRNSDFLVFVAKKR